MLEIAEKYGADEEKISQNEKEIIKQLCATIRYLTTVSFIKYSSIMLKTNNKVDKDIEKQHNKIIESYVVKRVEIKDYVVKLNSVLISFFLASMSEARSFSHLLPCISGSFNSSRFISSVMLCCFSSVSLIDCTAVSGN